MPLIEAAGSLQHSIVLAPLEADDISLGARKTGEYKIRPYLRDEMAGANLVFARELRPHSPRAQSGCSADAARACTGL